MYLMGFHESGSVRLQELQAMQDAEQRYVRLRDLFRSVSFSAANRASFESFACYRWPFLVVRLAGETADSVSKFLVITEDRSRALRKPC